MRAYILRRILLIIPTLIVLSVIVFLSIRLVPGSVIDLMVSQHGGGGDMPGSSGQTINPEAIRHSLGLDLPIYKQYANWVSDMVLHGNMGSSLWTKTTVIEQITQRAPITFELGLIAFVISMIIAIPIGIYSAVRQDTMSDYVGRTIAIIGLAVPSFWIATIIMVYPSVWWNWSPPVEYTSFTQNPLQNLQIMIIPAIIIGLSSAGTIMRYTRTMMLEVLRQDYIRTAWSKGLKERVVVLRHALKNALIPIVTILAGQVTILISGSVIMEQIFNIPGMGRLFLDVLTKRDYSMVSGLNLFYGFIGLVLILLTDLSYAWLDPRVRYN